MIANEKAEENIIEIGEGDRTKSDHVPVKDGSKTERTGSKKRKRKKKIIEKSVWTRRTRKLQSKM